MGRWHSRLREDDGTAGLGTVPTWSTTSPARIGEDGGGLTMVRNDGAEAPRRTQ
jgi:hypothetical protein